MSKSGREELQRVRRKSAAPGKENAQPAMERDALKRCVVPG
ncbi:hypothetical protein [Streptomyces sp. CA-106110]